jgi:hypothetical protein
VGGLSTAADDQEAKENTARLGIRAMIDGLIEAHRGGRAREVGMRAMDGRRRRAHSRSNDLEPGQRTPAARRLPVPVPDDRCLSVSADGSWPSGKRLASLEAGQSLEFRALPATSHAGR